VSASRYPLALLLLLAGCGRAPDIYAPPIQRQPLTGTEAHLASFIDMSDPQADAYIVRDVSHTTEQRTWRWAYKHPELRFYLRSIANVKFSLDAGVPDPSFKDTGPVTLTIRINDREFDRLRFDRAGNQHYEKPVPAEFLRAGTENLVAIEPDRLWISKQDGAALGFVLVKAGFVR
jgi:hypothetical protein